MFDTARLSRDVYEMLSGSPPGVVIAVWADGSISAHRQLGFRSRVLADGSHEEPLASFVSSSNPPSATIVQARLEKQLSKSAPQAS